MTRRPRICAFPFQHGAPGRGAAESRFFFSFVFFSQPKSTKPVHGGMAVDLLQRWRDAAFFLLSPARTAARYHKHLSPDSSGPDDGRAHTSAPPSPL